MTNTIDSKEIDFFDNEAATETAYSFYAFSPFDSYGETATYRATDFQTINTELLEGRNPSSAVLRVNIYKKE